MPFASSTRRGSRWGTNSTNPTTDDEKYNISQVERQIENARTRLADAGVNVDKDTDKRNWFEKATNLPEGQNAFLDALELLGRPGQAIMGGIRGIRENKVNGGGIGDFLQGAGKGFSGRLKTRGSEFAEELGVQGKAAQFAVGTGLEIGLDPLTYVPGGVLLKGAKAAGRGVGTVGKAVGSAAQRIPAVARATENVLLPAAEKTKDALGNMFVRDYGIKRTLDGGQDDFLERVTRQTENDRRYLQENALRNTLDAARTTGVDAGASVGRVMEAPLKQLDEAGNEIPRVSRELPADQGILDAAQKLTTQNDYIRKLAEDKGIAVGELEGYMRHVLSKAEREARKKGRFNRIDEGRRGAGNPNKKILSKRELTGSVEDINERIGREFFEPNAYFATAIGQKQLIDYIQAVDLRRNVLSNPSFARKYQKGEQLGNGEVLIDTNKYKFIKDGEEGKGFSGLLDEVGGQYVVTPQVKRVLDRYQKITTDDEGIKAFMRGFDAVNNTWKKLALFSPMYHVRNLVGAMFNNYVGGMSLPAVMKYTNGAVREVTNAVRGKESALYDAYRRQGLGSQSLHNIEFLRSVDPEKQIQKAVERGSKTGGAKALSKVTNAFETSREAGDFIDQVNRFAIFKWAVDKGFTPEQAAKKVRETQFDYTNLAPFEEAATRVVPFYRWMRFNMPFQIERFITDPKKYAHVNKIRLNAQEVQGLDEENMPDWMKASFAIPVSGNESTGTGNVLGLNLPLGDLTRLSNPLKTTLESVGSVLKVGPELAINRNTFYDRPIEQYDGQRVNYNLPGEALDFSLPARVAYLIEQLGGQPARMTSGYIKSKDDVNQSQQALQQTLGIATPLKPYDVNANEYYALREELQKLLDYIKYVEDQKGVDVRTLNEIKR